jgi:hypothetical protein
MAARAAGIEKIEHEGDDGVGREDDDESQSGSDETSANLFDHELMEISLPCLLISANRGVFCLEYSDSLNATTSTGLLIL